MLALEAPRTAWPVYLTPPAFRSARPPIPAGQAAEIYAIAGELVLAARVLMDHAQAASARGDRRGALVDLGQALQLAHAAKRLRRLAGFWRG